MMGRLRGRAEFLMEEALNDFDFVKATEFVPHTRTSEDLLRLLNLALLHMPTA